VGEWLGSEEGMRRDFSSCAIAVGLYNTTKAAARDWRGGV